MTTKQLKSKAEKQKEQEQKIEELGALYTEYKMRMEKRIELNEKVEIKPLEKWIRKVKKIENGIEQEIEVPGDTGETKNEKFKRLAVSRTMKALLEMDKILNLATGQYESSPEEQAKIVNALRLKVLDIENSFKVQEKKEDTFSF